MLQFNISLPCLPYLHFFPYPSSSQTIVALITVPLFPTIPFADSVSEFSTSLCLFLFM
ncbi:hypothetical protein BJ165DRAFT_1497874 [Panaeolus papilionaceus]|nr:hypothetical protein BJ165DRAFT_1497874 [Panaeolus papilionaceus]